MPSRREVCSMPSGPFHDAIEKAGSGHPGGAVGGMADMAEALWRHELRHNPEKSRLAGPGSLYPFQWPCFHAAICPFAPHGL